MYNIKANKAPVSLRNHLKKIQVIIFLVILILSLPLIRREMNT